jgi:hypothetical protein
VKTFTNFNDAFKWSKEVVEKAKEITVPLIAEEVYKDSDKYTYRDTGAMYDGGALNSDFKDGYVVERAPQVRMLYYNPNIVAGSGNKMAIPQWFERTKTENINKYKKMYAKGIEGAK